MKRMFSSLVFLFLAVSALDGREEPAPGSAPFSQSRFVPDISLIADFSLLGRNLNDAAWEKLRVPGLSVGTEAGHNRRGFNLRYAELAISAAADPYFDLAAVFHLHADEFEIEEAYARTRRLPLGLQLKVGKFLSAFGRINGQHAHFWSFDQAPLVSRLFFGDEGLNELGGQLTWVVPLSFFLQVGGEVLRGENEVSFGTAGFGDVPEVRTPGLWTAFAKGSWDVGRLTLLAGLSLARGGTRNESDPAVSGDAAFAGHSTIWGADLALQYAIDSYRRLKLQVEWLSRRADGEAHGNDVRAMFKCQGGFYADLTWRFQRRWQLGGRVEATARNQVSVGGTPLALPNSLWGGSLALAYMPSEFSRLRLQYRCDHSLYQGELRKPVGEISLGLNLAIGAHGAHPF